MTHNLNNALNNEKREYAADSHSGLVRDHNEDCFAAEPDLGLWLVADGVGGHSCGEVAAAIVRDTIRERVAAGDALVDAINAAHQAVLRAIESRENAQGMGSTVVAALLKDDQYEISWVGDSRAYLWNGRLQQLSTDHSRVAELLARQAISAEQAADHPERHILTQSIGVSNAMEIVPGQVSGTLRPGEHLLLCSDGLTDELSDSLMAHLLGDHETPRAQVDALMSAALDHGGNDNVTAVIIGEGVDRMARRSADLDTTRNTRRSASGGRPNDGRFPLKALALVTAVALLAVWLML